MQAWQGMSAGLVSVVIPTFNRAYCLPRAVDSALGQTHGNVEVIVIDDGSTDGTGEMIKTRYGAEPRVVYHHQANAGIAGARNAGLARATGDYVALLDSDDEWSLWKLELQLACMRAHPELGMTWTEMVAIDPDGKVINQAYLRQMYSAYRWFPTSESLFTGAEPLPALAAPSSADAPAIPPGRKFYYGDIGSQMLMGNLVHTSTVVLTRARAAAVKSFREDLRFAGEDYEFHLRTCRLGPVGYLDVASILYRRGRSDQATVSSNGIHMAQNFLRVIEPIILKEGAQTKLPQAMQNAVLAEAYAWVGEELLKHGDGPGARRELTRSLLRQPWQARTTRLLVASCLPPGWRGPATRMYRSVLGLSVKGPS
jgi:glycosyltransferase involved in cell wall biosynthesis